MAFTINSLFPNVCWVNLSSPRGEIRTPCGVGLTSLRMISPSATTSIAAGDPDSLNPKELSENNWEIILLRNADSKLPSSKTATAKYLPVAVLLEGSFESAFRNRMISQLFSDSSFGFKESGSPAAMLVVADGDIIRNDVRPTPQGVLISPLGLDRFTQQTFGNKEFIVNAIHYLTGHGDLINLRSRELTLRLLDKARIKEDRTKWVLTNTIG